MTGISCCCPLLSVVSTVVVVDAPDARPIAVPVIWTGLELLLLLLESLDLCEWRRTEAGVGFTTTPLPVAKLSSAKCFLLKVLTSILLEPWRCLIISSNTLRIFSAASVLGECSSWSACRSTGSSSVLVAIWAIPIKRKPKKLNEITLKIYTYFAPPQDAIQQNEQKKKSNRRGYSTEEKCDLLGSAALCSMYA